ncbi:probable ATP-dependent RNA helicase DDX10 [Sitodiplosis mosellana]|uniref:probable ATP-dependent RNA helicase DDX10 n=1 Tax=Sitodiplosis mosellana TaxID=263140 RepID=UPI002444DCDB|nr:probable ATP-dependent RNA helicase DDX10 [Sitodiplosis mosellana]
MEKKKFKKHQTKSKNAQGKKSNGVKSGGKSEFKGKIKGGVREDAEIKSLLEKYPTISAKKVEKFSDFPLSRKTLQGLQKSNYAKPTEIQRQSIGYALQGRDILGAAITGSGKTLAFLIPVMENLFVKKWVRQDGIGAIIILPTRELAYQIFETLKKVGAHHDFSAGLIIGGKNLKFERTRMDQCNVIICTPGRLLQHMDENPLFNCSSMQTLVLDEADRCLDMGFEESMNAIIENLPPERQTLLFSATQTKSVKDLARLSLRDPVYVAPHEQQAVITPAALKQNYVVIELEDKLTMLWSFVKNHLKQKTIVFMATCKQVKYIYEIFCKLRPGVSVMALYGTLHQDRRMAIYDEFCRKKNAVLLATDLAARGLDIPAVNWSMQLDAPSDPNEYIHRAGRTARNTAHGESLLVLLPSEEEGMVKELTDRKIPINKIHVDPKKMFTPRAKIEAFLAQNKELKESAQRALINYVKSIALMKNKEIFKVEALNIEAYAQSLGLMFAPRVKFLQGVKYFAEKKKAESEKGKANDDDIAQKLETNDSDGSENESEGDDSDEESGDEEQEGEEEDSGDEDEDESESESEEESNASAKPSKKPSKVDKTNQFNESSDDDEGDDFMRIKRRDHEIEEDTLPEVPDLAEVKSKKQKVVTKAALAKKLIKKKILPNKKVEFDEEGNELEMANKLKSDLAKEYEQSTECGIDISKARELIKEEDKFDKERFKQMVKAKHRKKKLKSKKDKNDQGEQDDFGSEEESDGPDMSWLPDPDKIYGNKSNDVSDTESESGFGARQVVNSSSDDDSESEEEQPVHKPNKRKLRIRNDDSDQSEEELSTSKKIRKITSKLTVDDAESFAMQLLSK